MSGWYPAGTTEDDINGWWATGAESARCPECGGEVVWEPREHEGRCDRCGRTADDLLDYAAPARRQEETA
jgi:DNA-directed RNA polymerase subunit RPC12/RpoP